MPELPEVETIARQLDPLLRGQRVRRLETYDPRLNPLPADQLRGLFVAQTCRVGKQVVLALEKEAGSRASLWLAVHLRMTGRLLWRPHAVRPRDAHLRARLLLAQGSLHFVDVRRFGTLRICHSQQELAPAGLDPLSNQLTAARLQGLLTGSRQPIKLWLLRQDRLVGIGNIYASEVLNEAGIHPWRPAGSLTAEEVARLYRALRRTLRRAIACCGTTFSDFQDARGQIGSYQRFLRVYDREGQRCRCGAGTVQRAAHQGRSTFFCSSCQPEAVRAARSPGVVNAD